MELFYNQASVLMVLFNHDSPANANVIASIINTSLKTVKKEVDELNYVCKDNGFQIVSYPGSGYMIEVTDRSLYEEFKDEVMGMYNRHLFYENAQDERVHFIIRQFLIRRNISMYDLMDECNCSESSIRRDMKLVKDELKKYKLTLINRTNKGTSLEGDEWHIRLALCAERYTFLFKNKVYFKTESQAFDRMFLDDNGLQNELFEIIKETVAKYNYMLSYDGMMRLTVLYSLAITRGRYSSELVMDNRFNVHDFSLERKIIREIFSFFYYTRNTILSEEDEMYLSTYLRSVRVLRMHELEELEDADIVKNIVEGFFMRLREAFAIDKYDTSVLYKDLCVGIYGLYYATLIDSHTFSAHINQQIHDGLSNLDLCALLYLYLHDDIMFNCWPEDVSTFYHMFLQFSFMRNDNENRKVLVVSDFGFFNSRTLANTLNRRNSNQFVSYEPLQFVQLDKIDLSKYAGIVSDIPALSDMYPNIKHANLTFFRRRKQISQMSQDFVFDEDQLREIFSKDDLYYTDEIFDEDGIYRYVRNIINGSDKQKDSFISEALKRNSVFTSTRDNNCYVINSFSDHLGYSFIKVICLKDTIIIGNHMVNKIIVYNVKGNSMFDRGVASSRVGMLLHHYNTYISFDKEKDYAQLVNTFMQ
ncbi:MAG: hypothetical protein E7193_01900 [Erysipelotrichaceae bacterium]|nr:hypothetical protein [Erysipelotrichaceae bacterium]